MVSLNSSSSDKVDACQLPCIIELRLIDKPIAVFPFVELLLTCRTMCLSTDGQVWQLLERFVSRLPDHKNPSGGFSTNVTFVNPDIPIIVNTAFLQHIQIYVRSPGHVNIFQWDLECFFFRHVELNSRFDVMTINEIPFDRPKILTAFSVILHVVCWLWLLRTSPEGLVWDLHSLQVGPASEWILGFHDLYQTIWLNHMRLRKWSVHHSSAWLFPLHWVSEHGLLTRP